MRGGLSNCGKLVMDALSKRGAAETRVLKLSSGYSQPSRRVRFDRAMAELQAPFTRSKWTSALTCPATCGTRWIIDGPTRLHRPARFRYLLMRTAIVAKYFETAAFGNERAIPAAARNRSGTGRKRGAPTRRRARLRAACESMGIQAQ